MNQGRVIRLPVHVVRELQQVLRARRTLENDPAFAARATAWKARACAWKTWPRCWGVTYRRWPTCWPWPRRRARWTQMDRADDDTRWATAWPP
jgi:hypothetical protein